MSVKEKDPAPTPPHKGEGLDRGTVSQNNTPTVCSAAEGECGEGRTLSPSPLWGGVGEGFSP